MAEENPQAAASEEATGQVFALQRVYLKDSSFEVPNAPLIYQEEWKPEVSVNLSSKVQGLADDVYEVVLSVTLTAKLGEKVAYLCEIHQAGVFTAKDFSKEELGPILGVHCPTILFPYAREVVSDLVSRGTFPQMLLKPVDFAGLYTQHLQQQEQGAAAGEVTH